MPAPQRGPFAQGSLTHAAETAAKQVAHGVPAPVAPPPPLVHEEPSSPLRLALVVMGFLAATILVVVALLHASGSSAAELSPDEDAARLGLPAIVGSPHDADFATLVGGGVPMADLLELQRGGVLLVFARPSAPVGLDTAEMGVDMHRRLRNRDLEVVLVLPRESVAAGANADEAALREALRTLGITSDVKVLLDPADERGPGRLRRGLFTMPEDDAAILLEDGVEVMRVVPPSPALALSRAHLAPLVRAALSRHGERLPPPPAPEAPEAPEEPAAPPGMDAPPK